MEGAYPYRMQRAEWMAEQLAKQYAQREAKKGVRNGKKPRERSGLRPYRKPVVPALVTAGSVDEGSTRSA